MTSESEQQPEVLVPRSVTHTSTSYSQVTVKGEWDRALQVNLTTTESDGKYSVTASASSGNYRVEVSGEGPTKDEALAAAMFDLGREWDDW